MLYRSKSVFLVRHAESVCNANLTLQGQSIDSPLSHIGIKQSYLFHKKFSHIYLDKIYTSGLARSRESVRQFVDSGIPYETLVQLNEISWGILEGKEFRNEVRQKYISIVEKWKAGNYHANALLGESIVDVVKRLDWVVRHILLREDERSVLLVTHNRTLKILLCLLLGFEIRDMDRLFNHKNLTIYHLYLQHGKFELKQKLQLQDSFESIVV